MGAPAGKGLFSFMRSKCAGHWSWGVRLLVREEIIGGVEEERAQGHLLVRLFCAQCEAWFSST